MSEQSPPSTPGPGRRRSSLTELFIPRPIAGVHGSAYTSPNANTMASTGNPQSRRGLSVTTLGLGGTSPSQSSPLHAFNKNRRASVTSFSSTSGSPEFKNSFEDSAVMEEDHQTEAPANSAATSNFARRVSFGAQALRDVKSVGGTSGGRRPSLSPTQEEQSENESNHFYSNSSKTATRGGSRGLFLSHPSCYSGSCFRILAYRRLLYLDA